MSYGESKRLSQRKAELETQFREMPDEIRAQIIPRSEEAKERAELRTIAKEVVADFRKTVVEKRRELRKAERDLSEMRTWYRKRYGKA